MLKNTFLYCFLLFNTFLYSQCPSGDVILDNQSDVQEFLNNFGSCNTIDGDLKIGFDVTDISELTSIVIIRGSLELSYAKVNGVSNFYNLEHVGGDFIIRNSKVETVASINNLHTVGGDFIISENHPTIISISGFEALQNVGGNFFLNHNNTMQSLTGFENLTKVDGWFSISNNREITNVVGFDSLLTVGAGMDGENDYNNAFVFSNNLYLETISGFNKLEKIHTSFRIVSNFYLRSVEGFSNLKSVDGFFGIMFCPILSTIPDFNKINDISGGFEIAHTDLPSVSGFNSLQTIDIWFIFHDNPSVVQINGFNNLTSISGSVQIFGNEALENISGFYSLLSIGGILSINNNESLTTLTGLESLEQIGFPDSDSYIVGNYSLLDCSAICNLLTNNGVIGNLNIYGNPSACSSLSEVEEICGVIQVNHLDICINDTPLDLFNLLPGEPLLNGTWSPALSSESGILDPAIDSPGLYTYTFINSDGESLQYGVMVKINEIPNAGEDIEIELCFNDPAVDLLGLLGGDVDSNGYWTPSLSSGTSIFNPSVDSSGEYLYTVYNESCGNDVSTVTVLLYNLPNAGQGTDLEICINEDPLDLFDFLEGSPDTYGFWTPILSSGNSIFNPSVDLPGTYVYSVNSERCGSSSTEINITVNDLPYAGEDGEIALCSNSEPIDLFEILGGNPNANGYWFPNLISGTSVFDPQRDTAGVYKYVVDSATCGSDESTVLVTLEHPPNAGVGTEIEVCITENPINLFELLGGMPDTDGYWSPNLASGTSVFNPKLDSQGEYNYTVTGSICETAVSQITISVINSSEISNYEISVTEFSNNNSIEVNINSNSDFEYSIDGISWQRNNRFFNLSGGYYTIYVRELNGCGVLELPIPILDYPKYFTPNGDGFNDCWSLSGISNQKFKVYIFDRYGKNLKLLDDENDCWDGTYQGQMMPSNDYWFKAVFNSGITKINHFTLKR
ncbi:T9SS type B sorting domain-containing protein [Paucihalobacter ruber]|uniref:T9SS type B sorting domain-containing protein n=1 Tax=Paucihalobacter ruber TaxID=2567861 RepID=A0A506PMG0_9FLAO|nr:T9SS type B sorting domain-containing protein [Paucihalobacter ruber]TPV33420.1 T9SS type B sorting domain-containing protein [Paucihalobacter ruber]